MSERKASMGDKVYRGDVVKFIRNNISLGTFMKRTVKTANEACWDLCDKLNYVPAIEEKPEPHWIPVTKDTLPQLNKVVVVCGDKGTWDVGRYRGYSEITENINLWHWKNNTLKRVYWWMYKEDALPEPTRG